MHNNIKKMKEKNMQLTDEELSVIIYCDSKENSYNIKKSH